MNRWIKWSAAAAFIISVAGGIGYYQYCCKVGIYDLVEERDKPFIMDIFTKNWYWLVAEGSTEFSPEYMLHHQVRTPSSTDHLYIKVLYQGQEPIGFTAYYKEMFYKGRILFVAVREEFRSQGYGRQLIDYAIDELKKMGATTITLVTRTTNYAAQKLYQNAGFTELTRDDRFVSFEYNV